MSRCKPISVRLDKQFESSEKAQEAAEFAVHLFRECLLFEQLSQEQINLKKRKRAQLMNQICSQVNMMGIERSAASSSTTTRSPTKRAKLASPSSSMSSPHDENNNNDGHDTLSSTTSPEEDDDDDEQQRKQQSPVKKLLAAVSLTARGNTWIGRRNVKRDLIKSSGCAHDELELEKLCSQKLIHDNACSKEIDFKCEFEFDTAEHKLNIKFALIDSYPSQSDLVEFDTLAHFLHVFVNTSMDKASSSPVSRLVAQN